MVFPSPYRRSAEVRMHRISVIRSYRAGGLPMPFAGMAPIFRFPAVLAAYRYAQKERESVKTPAVLPHRPLTSSSLNWICKGCKEVPLG